MDKDLQPNLEIQVFSFPTLNPAISAALSGLKSFSPGEVYEFLQHRFPLQNIKSKAHAKTASSLINVLYELIDSADLERMETNQINQYIKTLQSFMTSYEASTALENECSETPKTSQKKKFSETLLERLKATAEAERKSIFGGIAKSIEANEVIEAKFRKVKKR